MMSNRLVSRILSRSLFVLLVLLPATLGLSQAAPPGAAPRVATPAAPRPAGLPAGVQKITSVEGITEYRLANGLQVLLFPDESKEMITVNITYLVGSRHEGYGETGMAHLLEHLMFMGTPRHPDIKRELTAHGASPNGTTWYDRTNYFETVTASEANLDWALDLEADRMLHSFVDRKHLDSEMTVVRNEFEVGENYPQQVLLERLMSAAYLWHNYGKSTIGSRSDIERVPIENLQAFYRTWYQPDNAVLVVAGRIDEPATLRKIARTFGPIKKPTRHLPVTWTEEPAQDGARTVSLRRVGDTQMAGAAYHIPAGSHPDYAAVDVLSFILSDSPSGRLYKALVETKKAASIFGWAYQLHDPGLLMLLAEVRTEQSVDEARDILVRTAEGMAATPPTAEEVGRARDNLLKNWDAAMRNTEWASIGLSEWAALGDWRHMFLYRDRVKAVTPEDVARVAKAYLREENRTSGTYVPTKEPQRASIPLDRDIQAMVKDYKGGEALSQGEQFDPTPAAYEARIIRTTLPQGIALTMVPKKTRGATVNFSFVFRHGDAGALQGQAAAADLAGDLLMRGTTKHTRQQIQDELDKLKAMLNVNGGSTSSYASGQTTRENLEPTLRLAAEMLREPAYPDSEFARRVQEKLAGHENARTDPFQKAGTRLAKHLHPWPEPDPRYAADPDEWIGRLKALTVDDVKRFHDEFYGASAAQLAVIGDFDPEAMKALLTGLFGDWKSQRPFVRLEDSYHERPVIRESIEAPDKESAAMLAEVRLNLCDTDGDYPAMVLGDYMTGGGFMSSRLPNRIRNKEGLSYGVGSYLNASSFDHDGRFGAYAIYAPQNAGRLVTAFEEEIQKILDKGFTPQELDEAKKGWLQERRVSFASDSDMAGRLTNMAYTGRTLAWSEALEKNVMALSNDQIMAAMRKHIGDPKRISIVQSGDFAKVKQGQAAEPGPPADNR